MSSKTFGGFRPLSAAFLTLSGRSVIVSSSNGHNYAIGQGQDYCTVTLPSILSTYSFIMADTILVVEDEPAIRELIGFACESSGYQTLRAGSVSEAQKILERERINLILLDWMLPDLSGLQWLDKLKHDERTQPLPVIMLTARGTESDKVAGLDTGADDYIVKPFSPRALIARIRAVLRRGASESEKNVVCGSLVMNESRFSAKVDGKDVKLGVIEFKLLLVLASNPGRVYSRVQLLERVWDDAAGFDERTVDVHVLRLRKQLSGTSAANIVQPVRGIGYRAADPTTSN